MFIKKIVLKSITNQLVCKFSTGIFKTYYKRLKSESVDHRAFSDTDAL